MKKRITWGALGAVILLSILSVAFFSLQPSPEDLLLETLASMESIADAHAVIEFNVNTIDDQHAGTIEVWGRSEEGGPGAFRVELLESLDSEIAGALIVSDGEQIWAFDPSVNNVLTGTLEEAKQMAEESDFFAEEHGRMEDFDPGDFEHPESAEEAIQLLMEYFVVDNKGTETIGSDSAYLLEFVPIADQMPPEFIAVGGLFNLWIDETRSVPLGFEYTGGTVGEVQVTVISLELNSGLEDSLFIFEIPPGAEIMGFEDVAPQSISLEEASEAAEFKIMAPMEIPEGATLVDILEMQGAIVQRYTWPEDGSFTIAQGISTEAVTISSEAENVDVRGVSGNLFVDEDGTQLLLTWEENGLGYAIAGNLTPEQALSIAESLQ